MPNKPFSFIIYICSYLMIVYKDSGSLPRLNKAIITIGVFDGVHLGHQKVLQQLLSEAEQMGGTPVLITFHPHPRKVLDQSGSSPLYVLNSLDEKLNLLEKFGIPYTVVVPFTEAFANFTAEEYVRDFLVEKFHPHTVILGYDHKFGKDRKGDYHLLDQLAAKYGFNAKEIPERIIRNITISSTKIREALLLGDIATANEFLGYAYPLSGEVVAGNKKGRTIGFPTANLALSDADKIVPGVGVYAVKVSLGNRSLKGMMNIGFRPTVGGTFRTLEVNILDFDEDIYGEVLTVHFLQRLRDEQKFNGLYELKAQLEKDREQARAVS